MNRQAGTITLDLRGALRRARRDDGFSLLEVGVALGLFAIVAVLMGGVLAGGLRGVQLGRQRTAATADANEVLEQARALAFADVGLVSSDPTLASDPRIAGACPSSCTFDGEPVAFATNTASHPFNPHLRTGIDRSPSTLSRAVYVTGADTNADGVADLKRVTVVVSWDRSAVGGVASSVSATTLISPNSPGTLGNPPIGNGNGGGGGGGVTTSSVPPLAGYASATAGGVLVEAEVGTGANLDSSSGPTPLKLRVVGLNGTGENVLNATSATSCSQQTQLLEGAVSTPASTAAAAADSITNPGPNTSTRTQSDSTSGVALAPLSVSTSALLGSATCTASGVTTSSTLPSESGSSTVAAISTALGLTGIGLLEPLGSLSPVELTAPSVSQSVAQANPSARRVDASASHALAEVRLLRQLGLGLGVIDLGMPDGLIHVTAYSATATASGDASTGSRGVTADPSKPLRLRIWNNGVASNLKDPQGNTIPCASQSGKYCVLTPSVTTPLTITESVNLCVGLLLCTETVTVDIFVRVNPANLQTLSLADGVTKVYRAEHSPVTATARLRIGNLNGSSLVDVRTTLDMGRILACAKYGVHPGGCS